MYHGRHLDAEAALHSLSSRLKTEKISQVDRERLSLSLLLKSRCGSILCFFKTSSFTFNLDFRKKKKPKSSSREKEHLDPCLGRKISGYFDHGKNNNVPLPVTGIEF